MENFNEKNLAQELKRHAKAVGIPSGAVNLFVERNMEALKKQLKGKEIITNKDLERIVTKELKKYNADLAYVYQNRDKII